MDARHGHRKHKESSMVVRARISFGDQMVLGSLRDQTPKFMKGVYARHGKFIICTKPVLQFQNNLVTYKQVCLLCLQQ
ncbi:unnamed protein product [Rhodiola kirilowii]